MKILVLRALRLCALAAFALGSPFAWAQAPGTGLTGTAHDFSGNAGGGATSGLCTYCHTPHKASAQNLLWNRTFSGNTFSWTDTVTTGGTQYASFGSTYQGTTVKCLSCHDGTVAVGDVLWFNGGGPVNFGTPAITDPTFLIGNPGGSMNGNHPVAMPYPSGNTADDVYNGITSGGGVVEEFVADPTGSGIRIYNDDGSGNISAGLVAGQSGIECASCHDPHNGSATVQDVFFLRGLIGGQTANYICAKCHAKN